MRQLTHPTRGLPLLLAFIVLAAGVPTAWGAGLLLYETGGPDLGTASAGRAATAEDASTAGGNPAGMTRLDRSQLLTTLQPIIPLTNFHVDAETTTVGGGGGNSGVFIPAGSGFYAYKLSDKLRLGVAFGSNFGGAFDYGKQWAGRYYLTRSSLLTANVNPSIAYRVNEWLSVGAGFSFAVARFYNQAKINNLLRRFPDGGLAMESWDEAFGGNVGVLVEPNSQMRFGITYQSPVEFKFGFHPHVTGLSPIVQAALKKTGLAGGKFNLGMQEPQQMMASAVYQVSKKFALMGNLGWQNWSQFGQTTLGISTTKQKSFAVDLHFSDTMQIAIGGQYQIGKKWIWSAGFAYDSSPVSEANRIPTMPVDRQLRYGTGIQYALNKDTTLGAAYELMDAGNAPFNVRRGPLAGRLQGDYPTNYFNFVALNLIWRF